jgi:hypothetical protein
MDVTRRVQNSDHFDAIIDWPEVETVFAEGVAEELSSVPVV